MFGLSDIIRNARQNANACMHAVASISVNEQARARLKALPTLRKGYERISLRMTDLTPVL